MDSKRGQVKSNAPTRIPNPANPRPRPSAMTQRPAVDKLDRIWAATRIPTATVSQWAVAWAEIQQRVRQEPTETPEPIRDQPPRLRILDPSVEPVGPSPSAVPDGPRRLAWGGAGIVLASAAALLIAMTLGLLARLGQPMGATESPSDRPLLSDRSDDPADEFSAALANLHVETPLELPRLEVPSDSTANTVSLDALTLRTASDADASKLARPLESLDIFDVSDIYGLMETLPADESSAETDWTFRTAMNQVQVFDHNEGR